jgi:prevent-host-death family protein
MDRLQWSLRDARNKLSTVVDASRKGSPQIVTKRGKPTVVVLSVEEYARLCPKPPPKDRRAFVKHLLAYPRDDGPFKLGRGRRKLGKAR